MLQHTGCYTSEHRVLYRSRIKPILSRTPGPEGLISASHLPVSICSCPQPRTERPPLVLGWQGDARATAPTPPRWHRGLGIGFWPRHGGGISTLCRFGADTQEPAFLVLVNGTETLRQIIDLSPRSSALGTAQGSLQSFGKLAPTIPLAGITRLVATIISSRRSLCFIGPEKGLLLS